MKLGYSAWGMPTLPIDEQIRIVKDAGFQGIELICIERASTSLERLDAAERRRIRGLLDASGLAFPALHASVNPIDPNPELAARNIERLRRSMDLSVELSGANEPAPIVLMGYGKTDSYEQDRALLVPIFQDLADYGKAKGVKLGFEFHSGQAIDRPERMLWLLEQVGSPYFGVNLDTSHFDVMGYSIAESVRPLISYAVHTHVKDQRGRWPNHEYLTPGDGDYDYVTYLQEMNAGGYTGFITGEISVMVQRKPGYDPEATARQTYRVLSEAFDKAGLTIG